MKKILLILSLAILSTTPAYADHGGGRGGHGGGHGGGWGWGGAWIVPALIGGAILYDVTQPQPIYVQPAPVYVQPAPEYVQRYAPNYAPAAASSPQPWYFCPAANAYYPYVTSCPSGWQAVSPTPPPTSPSAPEGPPPR